jgi:cell division protein FtsA
LSTAPTKLVAALDLGSTKVTAVVAEAGGDARRPTARVLGVGVERSNGIRRGVVRDIEEATRAIQKALSDAQRMAGVEVGSVYCGIAGEHVAGKSSQGVVSVVGEEIRTGDLARVNDVACNVSLGRDHDLLHAIPQDYRVDQQDGISEPLGMTGSRLEAEVYLVTVYSNAIQNLKRCVERAGYHVEEFVLEPLAASLPVLTSDELELGCALVDLGGGSTNVAIFQGGKIRHTGSSRIAGGHVTNDLVHGLSVTQGDADRLKERNGAAYEPLVPGSDIVELPSTSGQGPRSVARQMLAHIMSLRLREILEYVSDEITRAGFQGRLPAGVVLIGGGASTPGIAELAREVCAMPVRIGKAEQGLTGLADGVEAPRMAVVAGLALYGARKRGEGQGFGTGGRRGLPMEKVLGPIKQWFQDFF